jgi:hypothetical protein
MREHLDIGRTFSAIFELYKNNAAPLLGSALIIFLGTAILVALLLIVSPIFVLLSLPVLIAAQFWYQGMVIELVNRVHDGSGVPGIGELFAAVGPRLGRLIVAGILAGLGIALGLILLIAPGLYLMTIWAVIAPVIVIENAAIGAAFGRSRQLVQGDGWQVFGIVVIIALVSAIIGFIIRAATGSGFVGELLGSLLPNLLLAPVGALAAAVIYFELRRIKEGTAVAGGPAPAGVPGAAPYGAPQPGYGQQPGYDQQPSYDQQPGSGQPASYPPPPAPAPGSQPPPSTPTP